jgi:hypothetical protein
VVILTDCHSARSEESGAAALFRGGIDEWHGVELNQRGDSEPFVTCQNREMIMLRDGATPDDGDSERS